MNENEKALKPDARILIIQILVVSALSFSFGNQVAIVLLFGIVDLLVWIFLDWSCCIKNMLCFIFLLAMQYILQRFQSIALIVVTSMFCSMIIRTIPVYMTMLILVRRTPMNELLVSMRKIHIPYMILIPVAVMYRYIPTLRKEIAYVHESMLMRNQGNSAISVLCHPVKTVERYIVPLLFRSERITEELSAATLCKGLSVEKERTCVIEVKLEVADYLYLTGLILVTCVLRYLNANL